MALSSCSLLVNHIHITNQTTHSIVPSKFKRLDCARVVHEKTSCLVVFIRKSRVSKFSSFACKLCLQNFNVWFGES